MKNTPHLTSKLILLSTVLLINSVNLSWASVNADTKQAAKQTGAGDVTQLSFKAGSHSLSQSEKNELGNFIEEARKRGQIKEVRVAAWSDEEYPGARVSPAKTQVSLAEKRAETVKSYLNSKFKLSEINVLNMAKRPNDLQRAFGTDISETKTAMENTGAAPTNSSQTGLFGLKSKASHAVVLVYYK